MRKDFRQRPILESLESMVLLSGPSVTETKDRVAIDVRTSASIVLQGGCTGTYKSGKAAGAPLRFDGRIFVTSLGSFMTLKGSLQLGVPSPTGSLTLSTKRGEIIAGLTAGQWESGPSAFGGRLSYTITGGTGKWVSASGDGIAEIAFFSAKRGPGHDKFELALGSVLPHGRIPK